MPAEMRGAFSYIMQVSMHEYKPEEYYRLTGLKRSTVRHYLEKGIIQATQNEQNGYHAYSDSSLVQAMIIREGRALDYEVENIKALTSSSLQEQIDSLQEISDSYERQIQRLQDKQKLLTMHIDVLKSFRKINEPYLQEGKLHLKAFYLKERKDEELFNAEEEARYCIDSFPFVHITSTGMIGKGDVNMTPGYEYNPERNMFTPLHAELYEDLPPASFIFMRTILEQPLVIPESVIQTMLEYAEKESIAVSDRIIMGINAMERTDTGMVYFVSLRMSVKQ